MREYFNVHSRICEETNKDANFQHKLFVEQLKIFQTIVFDVTCSRLQKVSKLSKFQFCYLVSNFIWFNLQKRLSSLALLSFIS